MQYTKEKLEEELNALLGQKEFATQQYHKVCGAIELTSAMIKRISDEEAAEENGEGQSVPENTIMD